MIWFSAMSLAIEAGGVINSRLLQCVFGQITPSECQLMMTEKVGAAFEAGAILATGGNADAVIDNYRRHVALNATRLC